MAEPARKLRRMAQALLQLADELEEGEASSSSVPDAMAAAAVAALGPAVAVEAKAPAAAQAPAAAKPAAARMMPVPKTTQKAKTVPPPAAPPKKAMPAAGRTGAGQGLAVVAPRAGPFSHVHEARAAQGLRPLSDAKLQRQANRPWQCILAIWRT